MRFEKWEFCQAINAYKRMCEAENKICNALDVTEWEPSNWLGEYYDMIIQMSDIDVESDYNDIDYFCYELDFGKKWTPGCVKIGDEDVCLKTPEDLYDLLVRE